MGIEALLVGRVLGGRYRIEEVIGRGGMGAVYRATDERLGRQVALKVVTVSGAMDSEARERLRARFFREARSAAALPHHPNVVPVYDYGSDESLGLDYLVMELLRGSDLATRLATGGMLPLPQALRILIEAARGIAVGHRQGLIHRDVKPGNIFLARDANDEIQVRVVDFGIAKLADEDTAAQLTQDGRAPHSPAYASPEQLRGLSHLTPAADVFSLGAVGYQLVTGERPFDESDRNRMSLGIPVKPTPARKRNPALPASVEAIIHRALEFDPAKRYPDAAAMARELEQAVRSLADEPLPPYGIGADVRSDTGTDETRPIDADVEEGTAPFIEDEERTQILDSGEEERTQVLEAEEVEGTLAAPPPQRSTAKQPAPKSDAASAAKPRPVPPRIERPARRAPARYEERRSVGGLVVWAMVFAVLITAAVWGWTELQRAGDVAEIPEDTIPEESEDTVDLPALAQQAHAASLQGLAAAAQGRLDDAERYFREAVELAPDNYDYHRNLGLLLYRQGRLDEAEAEFEAALEADPARAPVSGALVYDNLARVRLAQGDTLGAIEYLREYVRREQNSVQAGLASRLLEELEASQNPNIQLIGEPVDRPLPGQPPLASDTFAVPPPPRP